MAAWTQFPSFENLERKTMEVTGIFSYFEDARVECGGKSCRASILQVHASVLWPH